MRETDGLSAPAYDIAQEREFYKYFQPLALGFTNFKQDNQATPARPRASPDRALTAFAQLAALRLDCRRAFISFFDRDRQYIVAEATKSLSLETDYASQPKDEIKYGATIIPRAGSICERTLGLRVEMDKNSRDTSVFMVPDCEKDQRFVQESYVLKGGFRFYAGVPITSPSGYNIGSYCVVDDRPRDALSKVELSFMKDMATTIMVHMDMARAKIETTKGEKMVRGLGSFVEGKASMDDWWMGNDMDQHEDSHPGSPMLPRPNLWAKQQYAMHHDAPARGSAKTDQVTSSMLGDFMDLYVEKSDDGRRSQDSGDAAVKPVSENAKIAPTSKQDTLALEVKATFGRATRVLRQSLDVDGVCCFDAKAGHTFGGLIDQEGNERPTRRKPSRDVKEGSQGDTPPPGMAPEPVEPTNSPAPEAHQEEDRRCEVLGFSTVDFSSIDGDQANTVTDGMTETFLRSMLRRFPHGKVLNFDELGNSPSELNNDPSRADPKSNQSSDGISSLRKGEAKFLRKIFPEVRSLAIVPLWDSRQQFFSGCVVWTRSRFRILTDRSELSYLAAFGDSIMAEVARIEAKIADKAKSDFISSISHELRSPLHGILGSVECLQDSELDTFQEDLVHTVETCGKTLLDTIDHLLDFAKINNFTRKGQKGQTDSSGKKKNIGLDVDVDLSVVTEEVLETVFAGHTFLRAGSNHDIHGGPNMSSATSFVKRTEDVLGELSGSSSTMPDINKKGVSVVIDINKDERSHWIFRTQAGAWRRILMNLFGNSLKYTKRGFVQVILDAAPLPRTGKAEQSTVTLTVHDSGKGIAEDYLERSLFVPFAQEDSLQPGTGLGLAITAAIIRSMGGTIDVKSKKGHGTTIKVVLEMTHAPYPQESLEQSIISSAARMTKGLKIGFVGFDADSYKQQPDAEGRSPDNARHIFMTSFHRLCHNWFGMDMTIMNDLDKFDSDIFLTTEQGFAEIQEQLGKSTHKQNDKDAQQAMAATPLLVLCDSATTANAMLQTQRAGNGHGIAEYISQPCGPRKLAKSLALCMERLEASRNNNNNTATPNESLSHGGERWRGSQYSNTSGKLRNKESIKNTEEPQHTFRGKVEEIPHRSGKGTGLVDAHGPGTTRSGNAHKQAIPRPPLPSKKSSNDLAPEDVRNVLLVDDNKINLQLLVTYIRKAGHNYSTAMNGKDAVDAYKKQSNEQTTPTDKDGRKHSTSESFQKPPPFDYVVMDVTMPVMDGLEATRQIRAHERSKNLLPTKVIALTGLASASAQQEAYGSGVNMFMTKPVKMKELGELLKNGEEEKGSETKDTKTKK